MVFMYAEYLHGAQGFILDDLHIGHNLKPVGIIKSLSLTGLVGRMA